MGGIKIVGTKAQYFLLGYGQWNQWKTELEQMEDPNSTILEEEPAAIAVVLPACTMYIWQQCRIVIETWPRNAPQLDFKMQHFLISRSNRFGYVRVEIKLIMLWASRNQIDLIMSESTSNRLGTSNLIQVELVRTSQIYIQISFSKKRKTFL